MKLLLQRHAFSDEYVEQIRKNIPSFFHLVETNRTDLNMKTVSADTILILYGSKQAEAHQEILVKVAHQPTNGFRVKLAELYDWLLKDIYLA